MKLWLISQTENTGSDTYDSAVVAAATAAEAVTIHPEGDTRAWDGRFGSWCKSPSAVAAHEIGEAVEGTEVGVILASFNAG